MSPDPWCPPAMFRGCRAPTSPLPDHPWGAWCALTFLRVVYTPKPNFFCTASAWWDPGEQGEPWQGILAEPMGLMQPVLASSVHPSGCAVPDTGCSLLLPGKCVRRVCIAVWNNLPEGNFFLTLLVRGWLRPWSRRLSIPPNALSCHLPM